MEGNKRGASELEERAAEFEAHRGRLIAMANRMLGTGADAEDAVQEAWLKLARYDGERIENLGGWLTTVVGRVCIDMLRARNARPEAAYDDRVNEWVVTEDDDGTPEDRAILADSVGAALMVVLDSLSPAERLAFVLHDLFAVSFDEVAEIVGRSPDAAKMLASRARRKVRGEHPAADRRSDRKVVDAFMAAAREGDFDALLRVLDPDVVWRGHTARGVVVQLGATAVAGKIQHAGRAKSTVRRVLVNDRPGVMAWSTKGAPQAVMACTVVDGRIAQIVSVIDPDLLAEMQLPEV
ncbi:sigma-70 family RNA polymerase sigma factor [Leifsonia flava]|uniref:Sigma-70 family RNA polymerase sigma factor n=1 Tax=Orlajensenia leifsoniae TaxID=2561933 RepID=A0A4Y9QWE1_9MICO|nr:sigma-70 family RNA polymerase sigma factor [Leifsonia flava]TFV96769.1 sigma-70 family RNA polymerase sigma factor [Leifsonia flava]